MDPLDKSFDFAKEIAIQLITLSTAILMLTSLFTKGAAKTENVSRWLVGLMAAAWFSHLCSIIAGMLHLMALTGHLARIHESQIQLKDVVFPGSNVVSTAAFQVILFGLGTVLILIYGLLSIIAGTKSVDAPKVKQEQASD